MIIHRSLHTTKMTAKVDAGLDEVSHDVSSILNHFEVGVEKNYCRMGLDRQNPPQSVAFQSLKTWLEECSVTHLQACP